MSRDTDVHRGAPSVTSGRAELRLAGGLLVGGLLLNTFFTLLHPSGQEDDHRAIFAEYADSDLWVAVHLGQFVGVLLALAGLFVIYRVIRATGRSTLLAHLAAAATVATAAIWAVLQGLDGVALKQATEAWLSAPVRERPFRFADAETVRWLEWGFQSYFRVLLGLSLAALGAAILTGRVVATWLGWTAVLAGVCAVAIGVDVGYHGLASGLQDALSLAFLALVLVFAVGVLANGIRDRGQRPYPG